MFEIQLASNQDDFYEICHPTFLSDVIVRARLALRRRSSTESACLDVGPPSLETAATLEVSLGSGLWRSRGAAAVPRGHRDLSPCHKQIMQSYELEPSLEAERTL
jgi:hypothetical protein